MADRATAITDFLAGSPWENWTQTPLAGDASARRYLRLSSGLQSTILMDAPPENGEDTGPFVAIANLLTQHGLAAPDILLHDPLHGLLLLGDLGSTDFAKWLRGKPSDEMALYQAAADVLLKLEGVEAPDHLKRLTPEVGAEMVNILGPYYSRGSTTDLCAAVENALAQFAPDANTLALRDFHAENLIWRAAQKGTDRVGLLDFQDAFVAPGGYDFVSLLRDARRDVSPQVADDLISYFAKRSRMKNPVRTSLACLGVQRNLRILGVFARLAKELGKPRYLDFMPRVWGHILTDLQDPALSNLREAVLDTVPAPSPAYLAGLTA
ncbi:MAG: phosphotransferase [Pseudomonadota bacterium]